MQKYQHNKSENGTIIYRRKVMDTKDLKKALMTSLIGIYDKLSIEDNCLQWHKNKPSLFFKEKIEPAYNLLKAR